MSLRQQGFSLIEMMVVVLIIGIGAAMALPGLRTAMANRRGQEAALRVVSMFRRSRSEAMAYGRAHLVRFDSTASSGKGSVRIYRGITNSCRNNNWTTLIAGPACGTASSFCIEAFDFSSTLMGSGDYLQIAGVGYTNLDLCYTSAGTLWWRNSDASPFTDATNADFGFLMRVSQKESDGSTVGTVRGIVIPFGGQPRIQR